MTLPMHIIINSAFGYAYHFSTRDTLILAASNAVIDFDHLIYFAATEKTISLNRLKNWGREKYRNHQPFLYVFHTLEFLIIFTVLARLMHNPVMIVMSIGFALHMLCDSIAYFRYYRSHRPWLKYFFPSSNFLFEKLKG